MPFNHIYNQPRLLKDLSSYATQRQKSTAHFHSESGQIFTETSVAVRSRHHSDWIGELKTPSLFKAMPPNPQGARSLLSMTTTKAAREFRGLTAEHFVSVPWPLARAVWQEIVDCHGESYHCWRSLAVSYPGPSEFDLPKNRYHLEIRQPSLALDSYFTGITSPNSSYLTTLRISPKETRIADLVSLARITNLAVLDLSDGQHVSEITQSSSFSERVMRTWSELALSMPQTNPGSENPTTSAFSRLRVLLFGWQEHLDVWLFPYLNSFPNLTQVILTDCHNLHQKNRKDWENLAKSLGWEARHAKPSAKSLRPYLNESMFPLGAVSGLYYASLGSIPIETTSRPMLECWIGTPRKWTHVLEDFPGTRTVYFDRVRIVAPPTPAPRPLSPVPALPWGGRKYSQKAKNKSRHNATAITRNCSDTNSASSIYNRVDRDRDRKRDRGTAASSSSTTNSPEPKRALKPKLRTKASGRNDAGGKDGDEGELDKMMAEYRR